MVGTPPDAFASAGFAHPATPRQGPLRMTASGFRLAVARPARLAGKALFFCTLPTGRARPSRNAQWTRPPRLTITRRSQGPPRAGRGAQVAQLVEHATENRSVGGSIPPLGTMS